jgi:Regulator of polyketide synthase expression
LGNLSIQASNRELRRGDGYLLTHLASVVQIAMLRSANLGNKRRSLVENMLSEIINGEDVDEEEFFRVLSSFGYTPGEQSKCLAIRIPKPSEKEYIRNFLYHLGTMIPAMYIPTNGEIAAMVVSATRAKRQGIDVMSIMEDKLKAFGYRAGLSDRYDNLLFTQQYFAQAQYALESGEANQESKYVSLFSDYCLDYILENCSGKLRPAMLWKEGFNRLLDHDINGRADYIDTLRAYLDNNLNGQRAADALYISRNSFLSRLERINALLNEDLDDPKVRFRYELSLLLYDKYKNES